MAEYIEREALETSLNDRLNRFMKLYGDNDLFVQGFDECIGKVEDFPNAKDVAPVRHGRWIMPLLMADGHIHGKCSHCHKIRIIDDYCSACGAVMDIDLGDTED